MQLVTNLKNRNSWQSEFRNSLKSIKDINQFFNTNFENTSYPVFIPKSFAQKIKNDGLDGPLAKQFLPHFLENSNLGNIDPIGDKVHAKKGGIIHRYQNRILFTPTTVCPIQCRYCFRKNELSEKDEIFNHSLKELESYLLANSEVNEVILTGGDPLVLSNKKIYELLSLLSSLNISYVRFHTRTPIILPTRIDDGLAQLLNHFSEEFTKILFFVHTNHSCEIDDEVKSALLRLKNINIDKRTQTVLLNGINNSSQELVQLFNKITECHFNPYYLHHPDKVKGAMHFHLSLEEGRRIYAKLRSQISGWAIPHYVIDNEKGKSLAFNPEGYEYSGHLINQSGALSPY